jgi:hypothetical protein
VSDQRARGDQPCDCTWAASALWRASLPGVDIGVDTWPAAPGLGGYIEIWYEGHGAGDYQPFLRLPGTPALPEPRLGEIWA